MTHTHNPTAIIHCPVCGISFKKPYANVHELRNSADICECCGCEYGYDDNAQYYQHWMVNGSTWFNEKSKPANWTIETQLKFQIRPWPPI